MKDLEVNLNDDSPHRVAQRRSAKNKDAHSEETLIDKLSNIKTSQVKESVSESTYQLMKTLVTTSMDSLQCHELYRHKDMDRFIQVKSYEDPVIMTDSRVLENMLNDERTDVKLDYCSIVQSHIAPHMRKTVTDWMLEVIEDQQC